MKKTAIRVSMRLNSSIEYLVNMPVSDLMGLVEEIIETDREAEDRRRRNRKRR